MDRFVNLSSEGLAKTLSLLIVYLVSSSLPVKLHRCRQFR